MHIIRFYLSLFMIRAGFFVVVAVVVVVVVFIVLAK